MTARSVQITGRVQGVGFRAFVERLALSSGLSGEVWNTWDDAVEAHVQHPDVGVLDRFIEDLRGGPGRVEQVFVSDAVVRDVVGFRIGETR